MVNAMASNSRRAFDDNAKDIERLLEIHTEYGGDGPGRRHRLEVLNKSAVVLITAIWEAYCEDITAEALTHIVKHATDHTGLPVELQKKIAKDLKAKPHELAVWDLAGDGWKSAVSKRLGELTAERNRRLNSPKSAAIDTLLLDGIGLSTASHAWHWKGMSVEQAKKKLDHYIELRGAIAHRGASASSCKKAHVEDFFEHVKVLVAKTGGKVNTFAKQASGKPLW
jgi:hypothetical protein